MSYEIIERGNGVGNQAMILERMENNYVRNVPPAELPIRQKLAIGEQLVDRNDIPTAGLAITGTIEALYAYDFNGSVGQQIVDPKFTFIINRTYRTNHQHSGERESHPQLSLFSPDNKMIPIRPGARGQVFVDKIIDVNDNTFDVTRTGNMHNGLSDVSNGVVSKLTKQSNRKKRPIVFRVDTFTAELMDAIAWKPLLLSIDRKYPEGYETVSGIVLVPDGPPPWNSERMLAYFDKLKMLMSAEKRTLIRTLFWEHIQGLSKRISFANSISEDVAAKVSQSQTQLISMVTPETYQKLKEQNPAICLDLENVAKEYYELSKRLEDASLHEDERKSVMEQCAEKVRVMSEHARNMNEIQAAIKPDMSFGDVIRCIMKDPENDLRVDIRNELLAKGIDTIKFVDVDRETLAEIDKMPVVPIEEPCVE